MTDLSTPQAAFDAWLADALLCQKAGRIVPWRPVDAALKAGARVSADQWHQVKEDAAVLLGLWDRAALDPEGEQAETIAQSFVLRDGHWLMVSALLARGVRPEALASQALDRFLGTGRPQELQAAVDRGISVNGLPWCPLQEVFRTNGPDYQPSLVAALLKHGADPNRRCAHRESEEESTPLHAACYYRVKAAAVWQDLLAAGADVLATNSAGQTVWEAWTAALAFPGESPQITAMLEQAYLQASFAVNAEVGAAPRRRF